MEPFKLDDVLFLNFWRTYLSGKVIGVHNYPNKIKYDFEIFSGNGEKTRIYNVDSSIVTRTRE